MNPIVTLDPEFSARFVMTLAHFLWQGAAIGLAVFALGIILRRASARVRYRVFVAALLAMALCPPVTFSLLEPEAGEGFAAALPEGQLKELGQAEPATASGVLAEIDRTDPTDRSDPSDLPAFAPANSPADARPTATPSPAGPGSSDHAFPSAPAPPWRGWRTYTTYLILAYAAGVLLMLARLALGLAGGGRLRKRAERITDSALLAAVQRHAEQLGLRVVPVVAYCQRVAVPTVVGVLRPMILLPASLATGMPPQQVELLLLHELAHIRRYDHLINIAQRLIEAALFFHPAVWYLSHRIRVEREHCCDDLVIALGGERHAYAESLVAAAALATGARLSTAALAATGKPSQLRRRIHRLLGDPQPPVRLVRGGWVLTALVAVALIAGATQVANLNSAEPKREMLAQAESTIEPPTTTLVTPHPVKPEPKPEPPKSIATPVAEKPATATDPNSVTPAPEGIALAPAPVTKDLQDKYNELSSQMSDPDWWLRKVAVQQMGDLPYHPHLVFSLILALKDEDPRVQAAAAEGLAKQGDPKAVKHLVAALKEESQVREAAAEALTHFKSEDVMPLLTLAAHDEEPQVFFGAITALGKQNTADAATLLIEFFPKIWDESYFLAKGSGAPVRRPTTRQQGANQGMPFEPGPLGERLVTAFKDMEESLAEQTLLQAAQHPDWETQSTTALIANETGLRDRPAIRQVLYRMLESPQDHARAAATLALGNALEDPAVGREALDKETADALVPMLRDPNPSVAHAAATVLRSAQWSPDTPEDRAWYLVADGNCREAAQLGSVAYEPLVHALHAAWSPTFLPTRTSSRNTDSPMDGIMSIEDPRKVEALIDAIKLHPDYTKHIASMLGEIGDPRAVDVLLPMLDHLDGEVRQRAAWALGQIGDSRAVDPLIKLLNDSTGNVRNTVIQALGRIGDTRAAVALRPLLDTGYRADAAAALGEIGDEASVPKLLELYVEESPSYAKALGQIGGDRVRDSMIEILLQNTDLNRRNGAAKVLGQLGDPAAIPALDDAIHFDTNQDVRKRACEALGSIGGEGAARVLNTIVSDQSQRNVYANNARSIATALSAIDNPIASNALANIFGDSVGRGGSFEEIRLLAAKTLAERGDPRARAMLEELREISQTRIEATNALQELEQQTSEAEGASPDPAAPPTAAPGESASPNQPTAPGQPDQPSASAAPDPTGQPEEPSTSAAPDRSDPTDPTDPSDPSDQPAAHTEQTARLTGPRLQFRWVVEGDEAEGATVLPAPTDSEPDRTLAVGDEVVLYEGGIANAEVRENPNTGHYEVLFEVNDRWSERLMQATGQNIGKILAIVFDGRILSAPIVQAAFGKSGAITGDFTQEEAEAIAKVIMRNDGRGDDEPLAEPFLYDKDIQTEVQLRVKGPNDATPEAVEPK